MSTYYRAIGYFIRAFLLLAVMIAVIIPISWLVAGEAFKDGWWAAYLMGIPIGVLLWWISGLVLRMAGRN